MKVSLLPTLQSLRSIYNVEGVMPRFEAYLDFMTRGPQLLPLGAFSPMGQRQPKYLEQLLKINAEEIALETANEVSNQLSKNFVSANDDDDDDEHYKIALVVVDAPPGRNTWTHRHMTDAEWRLENKHDNIPLNNNIDFTRWVTVQLWTDEMATASYIQQETKSALYRAAHQSRMGLPLTLQDYLNQEGYAMAFAGCGPVKLENDDLEYSQQVLEPLLQSTDYPTCFAALYGDDIAKQVGYPPLGLSHHAGFQVGLANALEAQDEAPGIFFEEYSQRN